MSTPVENRRTTGFYAPELDGLRCLAVAGVMMVHFSPTLSRYADWGSLGVRLFFVLSGFLITLVLLRSRERLTATSTAGRELQRFFIRRIFRLWPLYFASLFAAYALRVDGTESSIWWHLTFASNLYVFLHHNWPALLSHYWTLAVEQQFYVIWPFLLLLAPRSYLPKLLIAMLALGPLTRALLALRSGADPRFDYVLLPCCVDFFALGGAIAWWLESGRLAQIAKPWLLKVILLLGAGWILLGAVVRTRDQIPLAWASYDAWLQGAIFSALIAFLLLNSASIGARFLRLPALVYLGQISYGIYIFHNFMHRLGPSLLRHVAGFSYFSSETLHVLYLTGLSILVAAVSFHCFEEPMRKLGRRLA